jgi:hypothetical protein
MSNDAASLGQTNEVIEVRQFIMQGDPLTLLFDLMITITQDSYL